MVNIIHGPWASVHPTHLEILKVHIGTNHGWASCGLAGGLGSNIRLPKRVTTRKLVNGAPEANIPIAGKYCRKTDLNQLLTQQV